MQNHVIVVIVHRPAGDKDPVAACGDIIDGEIGSTYRKGELLPDIAVSYLPVRGHAMAAVLIFCA